MKNYKLKIFHNNKCSKSRALIKILEDKTVNFETINYLNETLDVSFLRETLNVLCGDISEVIRSNEKLFKTKFNQVKIDLDIDNIIDKLINNPILIQRPIVVIIKNGKITKSIICRPPEKILDFLIL